MHASPLLPVGRLLPRVNNRRRRSSQLKSFNHGCSYYRAIPRYIRRAVKTVMILSGRGVGSAGVKEHAVRYVHPIHHATSQKFLTSCQHYASPTNSASITWKTLHTTQSPYLFELIATTFHPGPYDLLTQIFWPDHMESQATFHHGPFPFLHHLPGTLCLKTFAVSTNYQSSNTN